MKSWKQSGDKYFSYNARVVLTVIATMGGSLAVSGFAFWTLYLAWEIALDWDFKNSYAMAVMLAAMALFLLSETFPVGSGRSRGIRIDRKQQPDLFARIENAARARRHRMPAEVWVTLSTRAWAQRIGFGGFGRQWRLTIGLPLLEMLDIHELEAVLQHEVAHSTSYLHTIFARMAVAAGYFPGDNLGGFFLEPEHRDIFVKITDLFGLTGYAQELEADKRLAAVLQADELARMLQRLSRSSAALPEYMSDDVRPLVSGGYVPPISSGLQMKLAVNPRGKAASCLVADLRSLERHVVCLGDQSWSVRLKPISWPDIAEQVSIPKWRRVVEKASETLAGFQLRHVYTALTDPEHFLAARLRSPEDDAQSLARYTRNVVEAALAVHLLQHEWSVSSGPGMCLFQHKNMGFDLRDLLKQIVSGEITTMQWESQLSALALELGAPIIIH